MISCFHFRKINLFKFQIDDVRNHTLNSVFESLWPAGISKIRNEPPDRSIFAFCLSSLIEILRILELFLNRWPSRQVGEARNENNKHWINMKALWTLRAKPVWDIKRLTLCSTETTFSSSKAKVIQSSRRIKFRARLGRQNGVDGWKLVGSQPGKYIRRHFFGYFRLGLVGQKFLWAKV